MSLQFTFLIRKNGIRRPLRVYPFLGPPFKTTAIILLGAKLSQYLDLIRRHMTNFTSLQTPPPLTVVRKDNFRYGVWSLRCLGRCWVHVDAVLAVAAPRGGGAVGAQGGRGGGGRLHTIYQ